MNQSLFTKKLLNTFQHGIFGRIFVAGGGQHNERHRLKQTDHMDGPSRVSQEVQGMPAGICLRSAGSFQQSGKIV